MCALPFFFGAFSRSGVFFPILCPVSVFIAGQIFLREHQSRFLPADSFRFPAQASSVAIGFPVSGFAQRRSRNPFSLL
jgi:hypothetical protein